MAPAASLTTRSQYGCEIAGRRATRRRASGHHPQEVGQMRRLLSIAFTGVLVGGCAGTDMTQPDALPDRVADTPLSLSATPVSQTSVSQTINPAGALDDAIDRLLPALGPAAASIGLPLRQLRVGKRLDAQLIDAAQRQLAALTRSLPLDAMPDAEALGFTLGALRAAATS
jgi:hypothetical protein